MLYCLPAPLVNTEDFSAHPQSCIYFECKPASMHTTGLKVQTVIKWSFSLSDLSWLQMCTVNKLPSSRYSVQFATLPSNKETYWVYARKKKKNKMDHM